MSSLTFLVAVSAIVCALVSFSRRILTKPSSNLPLPPGPKGWPIIGNLLDVPRKFEWITYHKWAKELGTDILCLNLAGTNVIVLDTLEVAGDLLEKRSAIYSGRPSLPMLNELMGWGFAFGFTDYGETWRLRRRLLSEHVNMVAVKQFRPQLLSASHRVLKKFLHNPADIIDNFRHMAADTILAVGYGLDVDSDGRESLAAAKEAIHAMLIAAVPGRFLVDFLPLLKYVPEWVPGANFKRLARKWRELTRVMIELPYTTGSKKIAEGRSFPSLISLNIAKMQEGVNPKLYTDENIKMMAGTIYSAASDTTVSALSSCVLALVCNPHVVEKAQKELDAVLQPGQLPDFSDEESLPYITAIVKETLRWRDVTPVAISHCLNADDVYRGYRLPKGSIVIGNSWAMLHNEDVYPDPFSFNPERFMIDGKFNKSIQDPELTCFGFGRRICPGRHMAYDAVWITVASLLAAFDIRKAVDGEGNTIEPLDVIDSALVCTPEPYQCSIKPRSPKWAQIIQENSS